MSRRRKLAWFVLGFLASAGVAFVVPGTAKAQGLRGTTTDASPWATTTRREAASRPDERDAAPDIPVDQRTGDPAADPADEPSDESSRIPQGGRAVVVDGDASWPPEPTAPRDGVIEQGPQDGVVDQVDPLVHDTRPPEDIAAFEQPAAGFDPEAFSIEFDPILDRRPSRLFRFEPFAPIGIRKGTFTFFPEIESGLSFYGNVLRSPTNARRDVAIDIRPSLRVVSNWRVHALEFRASGLSSFHAEAPTEDDRAYSLEARGRFDISRRTNLEAIASHEVTQELRGSINAGAPAGERTDVTTSRIGLSANHRFNRLSLQLRGTVTETNYGSTDDLGIVTTNRDRDFIQNEVAVRAQWEFKPTLAVFAESAFNTRDHRAASADGIERDSTGERHRVGVTFGNSDRLLRGEIAVGYGRQAPDDSRLSAIDGILVDANVGIRVSALTSVLLTARTDMTESTVTSSSGALTRSVGAEVRHAFLRRLIGTAALRLNQSDYEGIKLVERELVAQLGLEYYLNREVTLFGRYQHTDFSSTDSARDFAADEVRIGVRVRR